MVNGTFNPSVVQSQSQTQLRRQTGIAGTIGRQVSQRVAEPSPQTQEKSFEESIKEKTKFKRGAVIEMANPTEEELMYYKERGYTKVTKKNGVVEMRKPKHYFSSGMVETTIGGKKYTVSDPMAIPEVAKRVAKGDVVLRTMQGNIVVSKKVAAAIKAGDPIYKVGDEYTTEPIYGYEARAKSSGIKAETIKGEVATLLPEIAVKAMEFVKTGKMSDTYGEYKKAKREREIAGVKLKLLPFPTVEAAEEYNKALLKEQEAYEKTAGGQFDKAESFVSEKVMKKIMPAWENLNVMGVAYEKTLGAGVLEIAFPRYREFKIGAYKGFYEGIREEPIKTAVSVGIGFVAPEVFAIAGKGINLLGASAKTMQVAGKLTGLAIGTGYGASVITRVGAEPTIQKKGEMFGRIASTEAIPMLAGGYLGAKYIPRIKDILSTRGLKEIPPPIIPEVLSGEKAFPTATKGTPTGLPRAKLHTEYFKKGYYRLPDEIAKGMPFGYSATPEAWTTTTIGRGGQFYSGKGVSVHFTGVGEYGGYKPIGNVFEQAAKPEVYAGYFEKVKPLPAVKEVIRYDELGKYKEYVWPKQPKEGSTLYVPGYKPEVEGVIIKGTERVPFAKRYYFKYAGRRIPIVEQLFASPKLLEKLSKEGIIKGTSIQKGSYIPVKEPLPIKVSSFMEIKSSAYVKSIPSKASIVSRPSYVSRKSYVSKASYPSIASYPSKGSISGIPSSSYIPRSYAASSIVSVPSVPYIPSIPSVLSIPYYPSKARPISIPPRPPIQQKTISKIGSNIGMKSAMGYKTMIKRGGKWIALGGIRTKGEAIKFGEEKTASTLAATFKISPTKQIVYGRETRYIPSQTKFRAYMIRGERRIPLQETWIQKAGTRKEGITAKGARLATYGERKELQSFLNVRRRKNGQKKRGFW